MSETVQSVVTRVQRVFGDESGVQISNEDIIRWINDAQKRIAVDNEGLMETSSTTNSIVDQSDYSCPVDMSVLRSLRYKGFNVKPMSFAEFNEYLDGYASTTANPYGNGIPVVFTVWNSVITVFPKPNENITGGFTVFYIRHPTAVVTVADTLDVPDQYFNAVVDYCLAQAYELDEDTAKKSDKLAEFQDQTMKLNDRNKWIAQETYPTIMTLPEDQNHGDFSYGGGYY